MISHDYMVEIINEVCTNLGVDSDEVGPLIDFLVGQGYIVDPESVKAW